MSQPKSVISGASIRDVGVDRRNLATNTARSLVFQHRFTGTAKRGLMGFCCCCNSLVLNIFALILLTEDQLKPYILHTSFFITSNNSWGISHDKPNSWNLMNYSFLTIFFQPAVFLLGRNNKRIIIAGKSIKSQKHVFKIICHVDVARFDGFVVLSISII